MSRAVLHILGTAEVEGSSFTAIVETLAAGIDQGRYRLRACFLGEPGPLTGRLRAAGIECVNIPWVNGAKDPVGAWRFFSYLRRQDMALVHQHHGARAVRLAVHLASRAPIIVHLHNHLETEARYGAVPISIRGADHVVATSLSVGAPIGYLNPAVIYPGVVVRRTTGSNEKSRPDAVVVGAAARLVPEKGMLDLLQAMTIIHTQYPSLRIEIAGRGPQLEDLQQFVQQKGLGQKVTFLGWRDDLRRAMKTWDIFVAPSENEPFGITAIEAMAEGLPVIATMAGGLAEIVVQDETGLLVPPRSPQMLAKAIQALVDDQLMRARMSAAGRRRVRKTFSVARMVAQTEELYDSLCSVD